MSQRFKVGDHVTWNSEAGHVSGKIAKVHTKNVLWKGYTHHASDEEPQYEIKSDKTNHIAMHKGTALKKIRDRWARPGDDQKDGIIEGNNLTKKSNAWKRTSGWFPGRSCASRLMQMLSGFMTSQAIFIAAKLGLADLLKNGGKSVDELAQATLSPYSVIEGISL
jgi:hypothetical protein